MAKKVHYRSLSFPLCRRILGKWGRMKMSALVEHVTCLNCIKVLGRRRNG